MLGGYTLPGVIERAVALHAGREAVVDGSVRLTWRQLAERSDAFAAGLSALGVGRGDVVGLHHANGWEFIVATIALARLGAVSLALHPPYRTHELQQLLSWTRAVGIIAAPAAYDKLAGVRAACPDLATIVITGDPPPENDAAQPVFMTRLLQTYAGRKPPHVTVEPDDPLSLNPTSGTESVRPKICMHAHDGLLSNSKALAERAGLTFEDRMLCSGGYTHLFGMASLQMAFHAAATVVCLPAFTPGAWLDCCATERVSRAWSVPAQLLDIVAEQRAHPRTLVLREVRTGGIAIEPAFADAVRSALCEGFVIQWGMSEIGGACVTRPESRFVTPTLGVPLDHAEVRFVDANGSPAATGVPGEIWYRAADGFRGFLNDPETTSAAVTADGWVRTGDLGVLEDDGSVAFHGRTKDVINRGGLKIGVYEIEALLGELRSIRQLAVVGVPDTRLGEKTALVCSLRAGGALELDDVRSFLDDRGVAKYKWPEYLFVLDDLPVTATGKVAKSVVRSIAAERVRSGS